MIFRCAKVCLTHEAKATPLKRPSAAPEMPEGWVRVEKIRKTGASVGTTDVYWKSPDGKKTCRSAKDVNKYVGSLGCLSLDRMGFGAFNSGRQTEKKRNPI